MVAVVSDLERASSVEELGEVLVAHLRRLLGADIAVVARLSEDGSELELVAADGYPQDTLEEWERFAVAIPTPLGEAVRSKELRRSGPDSPYPLLPHPSHGGQPWLAAPLLDGEEVVGAIGVSGREVGGASPDLVALLGKLAGWQLARRSQAAPHNRPPTSVEAALAAGDVGTWEWEVESGEIRWSSTLEAIFGLAPGGFRGSFSQYAQLIYPEDRKWVLEAVRQGVEEGSGFSFEHRILRPDGVVRWLECRGGR